MSQTTVKLPNIVVVKSPPQHPARDFTLEPLVATDEAFCSKEKVRLHFVHKLGALAFGTHLKITDASSHALRFKCDRKAFSLREKKIISDAEGFPVLNMKGELLSLTDQFKIFKGDKSEVEIGLVTITRTKGQALKVVYTLEFNDVLTKQRKKVLLKGNLEKKRCCIYYQEGDELFSIANMIRTSVTTEAFGGQEEYVIDVDGGIDCAIVVALCIAMEEKAGHKSAFGVHPQD